MKTPIVAHLAALGWTDPASLIRGATVVGGPKGGPVLVIEPRGKRGPSIDLRAALPAGARVTVLGEPGIGVVEYSAKSHYARISAHAQHDDPVALLADMIEAGACIEVAS